MKMLIADFESQIVFIDKLFCINKVTVTNKSKKNRFDSDGKALNKTAYALAFHYDNGEISRVFFSSEQERDDNYNMFLAGDFTSYLKISKTIDN